ncbi:MAG: hypothetical protein KAR64_07585 [Thermoplasmatales archaeon]|nr:hypothetical protein [Thermoplasmatales archaeon]
MIMAGSLSTTEQVEEMQFIAKVCSVEIRIKSIVRNQKIKEFLEKEKELIENREI